MGLASSILSVLGYEYVTPLLDKCIGLGDTCGVHNLHGMPCECVWGGELGGGGGRPCECGGRSVCVGGGADTHAMPCEWVGGRGARHAMWVVGWEMVGAALPAHGGSRSTCKWHAGLYLTFTCLPACLPATACLLLLACL